MGCVLWVVGEGGVANVFCIPRSKYRTPRHELVPMDIYVFVCLFALRPKSTAKVYICVHT